MSIKEVLNRAKREKQKAKAVDTAKKVGTGLGIGAALGSLFGVLFAPKSGKETRKDIVDTAKSSVDSLKENANEAGGKIAKVIEEGKDKISNIKNLKPCKNTEEDNAEEGKENCDKTDDGIEDPIEE